MRSLFAILALAGALSTSPARAESSASCAGFITTLPATIATTGTWCLAANLGTALTTGNAITVNANSVTIDCNGFRIQAVTASNTAYGIRSQDRLNTRVRNCTLRGFYSAAYFSGGGGHLFENNLIHNSVAFGVIGLTDGIVIRGNRFTDTGIGTPSSAAAVYAGGGGVDVVGNAIDGVHTNPAVNAVAVGILVFSGLGRIEDNIVRGVRDPAIGSSIAISSSGSGRMSLIGNDMLYSENVDSVGTGMQCSGTPATRDVMRNNTALGFATPFAGCANGGDNLSYVPF